MKNDHFFWKRLEGEGLQNEEITGNGEGKNRISSYMIRIFKENGEEMTLLSEMSKRIKHVLHRGKRGREMKKEGKIDKKIKKRVGRDLS